MFALHGGQGPGWQSSTHLWTHRVLLSLPPLILFFVLLNCLPQTSPHLEILMLGVLRETLLRRLVILVFDTHEWGMSRRFHSGSLTLRQKQRYCMARSVVGEGFRQPGQTQLLSPETKQGLVTLLTCLVTKTTKGGFPFRTPPISISPVYNHVDILTFTFGRLGPFLDTVYVEDLVALLTVEHCVLRPHVL